MVRRVQLTTNALKLIKEPIYIDYSFLIKYTDCNWEEFLFINVNERFEYVWIAILSPLWADVPNQAYRGGKIPIWSQPRIGLSQLDL